MLTSNRLLARSTAALLLIGLSALFAIVAMNVWLSQRAQIYFDQVVEARDARTAAAELRSSLQMAESSQRGFLLTRNEIYLAPFGLAKALVVRHLEDVRKTFRTFNDRARLVDRIGVVTSQKLEEMEGTISDARDGRNELLEQTLRSNRGKALMDEANVLTSGAVRAADERLTVGVIEHRRNAAWLETFSIAGALVVIFVVGAAVGSIIRHTAELRRARDEISSMNVSLEQRVAERTKELAQANAEVQRFAYIVTHDLRAPLVNIMGFTSEVESASKQIKTFVDRTGATADEPAARDALVALNEDMPEAIDFIRSSTKKMDRLIAAILRIAREGGRTLRPEPIDLRELVDVAATAIGHQLAEANGTIDIDLTVAALHNDRLSIEQILGNLLDNAVKYRALDRPLRIRVATATASGERIRLTIEDNGRGIAEQDQERVFELFRRAGVLDQPGDGIGLSYVRAIVRKLGGEITMRSKLGEGTSFDILFNRELNVIESHAT